MAKKSKAKKTTGRPLPARVKAPKHEEHRTFRFEQAGGNVITWNVPAAPYKGDESKRPIFVGGFEARVQHVHNNLTPAELVVPIRFNEGSDEQRAFEDGYHEAARQDGQSLVIRKLTAKTAAGVKAAKKR